MLFNSFVFIVFLAIVLALYYTLPLSLKWIMLLIASCIFYMWWQPELIVLILVSALVNYSASVLIENRSKQKKLWLVASMIINFGLLAYFKYMGFLSETLKSIYLALGLNWSYGEPNIVLPMGISFYTFQAASYTIDIYYGKYKAERNYFKLLLFITYFPQLVAGPIERADRLLNQLFVRHRLKSVNISAGIKLMLMGYFKKVVIADRAATLVNTVYNSPTEFKGLPLIIATLFFTVQIYCDFSGYTDIARGTARLMDIDLMFNFDRPYFSKSIKEFWRRWHISLSSWLKDYVYIPLGGSRCSMGRKYLNLMITFLASGLWHGASWTYVLWGGLHGVYQILGDIKNRLVKVQLDNIFVNFFRVIITFILVAAAWVLFRANSVGDAFYIYGNLFVDLNKIFSAQYLYEMLNSLGLGIYNLLLLCCAIAWLIFSEIISFKYELHALLDKLPFVLRFGYYYILALFIFGMGVFSGGGEFIYFQF